MPPKGFMTPKQPGSPDYSPAGKVGSPTAEDLEEVKKNTPSKNEAQRALREEFDKVGGRKRKSRKTKRKTRKSRRTRRRS